MDRRVLSAADMLIPYIGLVREAIALRSQLETEETTRLDIRARYDVRMKELDGQIKQMEEAIAGELDERDDLRQKLHEQCMTLIKAGAIDAALVVNERMMKKFQGSFIGDLLASRKMIGPTSLVDDWRE